MISRERNTRECTNVECPYCYHDSDITGKRQRFCGMARGFIEVGCPGTAAGRALNST